MSKYHNPAAQAYSATADRLTERIESMVAQHPEIMTMTNVWDLFKIEGFTVEDIQPSFAQASWALSSVQQRAR